LKIKSHDENGFPMNYNPETFYQDPERLYDLPPSLYNTEPGLYKVSTWGRILNTKTGNFVPRELKKDRNIYSLIAIKDVDNNEIHIPMHQIMARMFVIGKRVDIHMIPNHLDGVKWHNEPYNLSWETLSGNTKHADENNLIARPYGEDNGSSSLSDEQYNEICKLTEEGYMPAQINKIMNIGIDITNIAQKIRSGESEALISSNYNFSNIPRNDYRKFNEDQVRYICLSLQDHPDLKPIDILRGLEYDVDNMYYSDVKKLRDTISCIKRRVSYTKISSEYNF
jgi:hypothetical protein